MFERVLGRIGRRGVIVAAAVLGVAMVAAPTPALAATGNVTCTSEIDGGTITGNVTVPAGASCYLNGTTGAGPVIVEGNVAVDEGATFVAIGAVMQRNLSTEGAYSVNMIFSEVDGNSSFDATSGNISICGISTVSVCAAFNYNGGTPNPNPNGPTNKFGNVSITNTSPGVVVYGGNFVAGNLSCSGNVFVSNFGYQNQVVGHESGQCAGL